MPTNTDLKAVNNNMKDLAQEEWTTPQSSEQAFTMAETISRSDLAPPGFKGKPENTLIAMQMGAELGLNPMQAIQNIAVINGRPCLWGDAMLALVMKHKDFAGIKEAQTEDGATCVIYREIKGEKFEFTQTFTKKDAENAGLLNKGPWKQYLKRMLQMRARGFALRDAFADALRGLNLAEEVRDYEIKDVTPRSSSAQKHNKIAEKLGITVEPSVIDPEPNSYSESSLLAEFVIIEKAKQLNKLIDDNQLQALRNKWLDSKKLSCFEEFSEAALDYCLGQVNKYIDKTKKSSEAAEDFYAQWDAASKDEDMEK